MKSAGVDLNTTEKTGEDRRKTEGKTEGTTGGKQEGNRRKTSEVQSGEVRFQCDLFCTSSQVHVCVCHYSALKVGCYIAKLNALE